MNAYAPPLRDLRFVLDELLAVPALLQRCGRGELDADTIDQVLEGAGRFAAEVIAPLNADGDRQGCGMPRPGEVRTPDGFADAYRSFADAGWTGLGCSADFGGQALPLSIGSAVNEMLSGANMAWAAYPGMSHAAYLCIEANGSEAQKALYLPRIASGDWAGTMCLTEPHCGTDLGLLRTRALAADDRSYRIVGSKIFISGGEQDLTDNIVHLVLARLEDAPPGVKGISLFVVPKLLPDTEGRPGVRNAVSCSGIEQKMGIHGNATCTLDFDAATGWLLGQPNQGLAAMFVMMNHARVAVGVNAVGLMEAARQKSLAYAREREQGRAAVRIGGAADPIIAHADVRRMLLTQKAWVEGARALALWATTLIDSQHLDPDAAERHRAGQLLAIATPVVKAFCSDLAVESIGLAMQCFGGHGYIRDNGVEQHLRDARIIPLYEGTNGVQAMDLLGRKVIADGGRGLDVLLGCIDDWVASQADADAAEFCLPLSALVSEVRAVTGTVLAEAETDPQAIGAAAAPYLRLVGHLLLAWMWARMAALSLDRIARDGGEPIHAAKLATARFHVQRLLPEVQARCAEIRAGAASLTALPAELF
jgi:alkylation response protein AidB-like acyl-CoA dehydrogenase